MREIVRKTRLLEPLDVDALPIMRDSYFRNAYVIDLPLDSSPDHVWQDILEREWKSSMHVWDRKLFVVGDKLRLVATIDDVEDKIDWVKQVIEQTNKDIEEYNQEATVLNAQEGEEAMKEQSNVEEIRKILRKRLGAF